MDEEVNFNGIDFKTSINNVSKNCVPYPMKEESLTHGQNDSNVRSRRSHDLGTTAPALCASISPKRLKMNTMQLDIVSFSGVNYF